MAVYTKIKEDFWSIIQEMQTHIPDFVVDPNKHFLRNRKLNFETILNMLNMHTMYRKLEI